MAKYQAEINSSKITEEAVLVETVEITETPVVESDLTEAVEPVLETVVEVEPETVEPVEVAVETAKESPKETAPEPKIDRKEIFRPRTEYVSKFEKLADASRQQETQNAPKRRRYNDRDKVEPIVNTAELLKEMDYEIAPEYTEEELEQIRLRQEAEESSWIEDDIDFDEFDEYYDAE